MRRAIKLGIFTFFVYVMFLFFTFPAERAYHTIADQLPPTIKLYGLTGTLWSGQAELLTLASQQYRNASWRFQIKSLLSGEILFYLNLDNGQSQIKGNVGINLSKRFVLRDILLQQELVDLQALARSSDRASAVVGGKISGRINSLVLSRSKITDADAHFVLRDVALLLPRRTQWGDFKVDIEKPDVETLVNIADQGGPLLANGSISINETNDYDVSLTVQAASGASNDLIHGLGLFGQPGNDGKTRLNYKGSLSELLGVKSTANDKPI
ncbi:type II secretion system protein N [Beggiatoa alba]|nr:type II secretion system protein N [Beggiatoa alba]